MEKALQELQLIVKEFEMGNYTIEELQSRLETSLVPNKLEKFLFNLTNDLEEIRFTRLEANQRKYALAAIKKMFHKIEEIM